MWLSLWTSHYDSNPVSGLSNPVSSSFPGSEECASSYTNTLVKASGVLTTFERQCLATGLLDSALVLPRADGLISFLLYPSACVSPYMSKPRGARQGTLEPRTIA